MYNYSFLLLMFHYNYNNKLTIFNGRPTTKAFPFAGYLKLVYIKVA